jgi:hypothetical protein
LSQRFDFFSGKFDHPMVKDWAEQLEKRRSETASRIPRSANGCNGTENV